jgi:carbonic anhydrase/acetyltransferase-like protein (isoleucine patch superfamily)
MIRPNIRAYKGLRPRLGERVYVDPSAQIIGDVELGDDASIWMNTVVRGDVNAIRIGARTNIQDNCVVHVQHDTHTTRIAHDVTIGHSATVHGCEVGAFCLIGIGAILLNGVVLGEECIVAAGAVVPEGMVVPPRSLLMGMPARVRRSVSEAERAGLREYAANYVQYKQDYLAELDAP